MSAEYPISLVPTHISLYARDQRYVDEYKASLEEMIFVLRSFVDYHLKALSQQVEELRLTNPERVVLKSYYYFNDEHAKVLPSTLTSCMERVRQKRVQLYNFSK